MELQRILSNNPQLELCYQNKDAAGFRSLFAHHLDTNPQLKDIYNTPHLRVYDSIFTRFDYFVTEDDGRHAYSQNNLFFGIQFFGFNLREMNLEEYTNSDFLPIIRNNCPNLSKLKVKFCKCRNEHFEHVFEFMPQLVELKILWQWKNLSLPNLLIDSLADVRESLKTLHLFSVDKKKPIYLTEKFNDVFSTFNLTNLRIDDFDINNELVQLIEKSDIKKLHLDIEDDANGEVDLNLRRLCNLKNMSKLTMYYDIDDSFIEELTKNSQTLEKIKVSGLLLTNKSVEALTKLKQLEHINLLLCKGYENKFLDHHSVENFTKMTELCVLNVNYCIKFNSLMVYNLICKLKKLHTLWVGGTSIDSDLFDMLLDVNYVKRKVTLEMYVSCEISEEDSNGLYDDKNIIVYELE